MDINIISTSNLTEIVREAFIDRLCIEAVVADYGKIYLGFGDEILPPPTLIQPAGRKPRYQRHGEPPYELITSFSEWWIENAAGVVGGSDDKKDEVAASHLVGKRALSWDFLRPSWGLRIDFENGLKFQVLPYAHLSGEETWRVRTPDQSFIIRNDGSIVRIHK